MSTGKWVLVSIMALLLLLIAVACAPQPAQQPQVVEKVVTATPAAETTLDRILREGRVYIGFANVAPYASATEEGEVTGAAPSITKAVFQKIAEKNGLDEIDVVGVLSTWGSLIPGLQAGRFDLVTSGMFIYPERCEQVLFADPQIKSFDGIAVQEGNPFDIYNLEDIAANPDFRIGTGSGYSEYDALLEAGVPEDQISLYPDDQSGFAALQADRVDGFITAGASVPWMIEEYEADDEADAVLLTEPDQIPVLGGEPYVNYSGAGFRMDDVALRDAYNAALDELKESGELAEILESITGFTADAVPDVTAEEVCQ